MKLLITGVSGYIGSHLVNYLANLGGYEIYGISRNEILDQDINQLLLNIKIFQLDRDSLPDILKRVRPDVVIHLASCFLSQHSYKNIKEIIKSNVEFPTELLEAMNDVGVKKIINTGTSWQCFNSDTYNPVNLYAASKQAFEDILKYYINAEGFSAINLKLFDTYGGVDKRRKLISLLDDIARNNKQLDMSPGGQLLDLVHINDVCRAFKIAIDKLCELPSEYVVSYGVSNKDRVTLKELVSIYERVNNIKLNINFGTREYRNREVMVPCTNIQNLPDWEVVIPLSQGLKY